MSYYTPLFRPPTIKLTVQNPLHNTQPVPDRFEVRDAPPGEPKNAAIFDTLRGAFNPERGEAGKLARNCIVLNDFYRQWVEWSRPYTL